MPSSKPAPPLQPGDLAPPLSGQPVFGLPVKVGPGGPPTVVVFLRGLGSPTARATIAAIQARVGPWDARGVAVVGVTRTDLERARDFIPRYHVLFPVLVDPEGRSFLSYGVGEDSFLKGTLTTLRPSLVTGFFEAMNTFGQGTLDRPIGQLQGVFLVGRDGRIAAASYTRSLLGRPDLAAVEAAVERL